MNFPVVCVLLLLLGSTSVEAQTPAGPNPVMSFLPLIVLAAVVWFLISRSRRDKVATSPGDLGAGHALGTRPVSTPEPIVVRTYKGSQKDASMKFQDDARKMAQQSYVPISQSYAPGAYTCGEFLLALFLVIVVIGVIIFVYMIFVKPAGTLSVTYEYRPSVVVPVAPASAEKVCPQCAEHVRAAALICRFCGHKFEQPSGEL